MANQSLFAIAVREHMIQVVVPVSPNGAAHTLTASQIGGVAVFLMAF